VNDSDFLAALRLPTITRVDQRVPKKLLLENGAPTAADKRSINEGIEEIIWVAALKPTNIGVPLFRDNIREYLEVAVLCLTLRDAAKETRLLELLHRAIPYPVLLFTNTPKSRSLSTAHKRWSQGDASKTVLDGELTMVQWNPEQEEQHLLAFCSALSVVNQPRTSLMTLYQGWTNTLLALHSARFTGIFSIVTDEEHASRRHNAIREIDRIDAELVRLRAAAVQEKQMSRRVELNVEMKRFISARAKAITNL
jgi:hypothetical protein